MKQNITLSLDKELIRKARVIAAGRQISVSKMLAEQLQKMVTDSEYYEWSKRRALANLEEGFHLGGKGMASREELHDR